MHNMVSRTKMCRFAAALPVNSVFDVWRKKDHYVREEKW